MCFGSNSRLPTPNQPVGGGSKPTTTNKRRLSPRNVFPHQQSLPSTSKPKGNWRRRNNQVVDYSAAAWRSSPSQTRQPPHRSRSTLVWQPTVPSWEKKFCSKVGFIPWEQLLETKKLMSSHYYENIVKWNDSAGEEAFNNAKARFWAETNNLPCDDISLPDPDMYIDEIDWNAEIDPELESELDKAQLPSDDEDSDIDLSEYVWFKGDVLYFKNQPVVSTGWGD